MHPVSPVFDLVVNARQLVPVVLAAAVLGSWPLVLGGLLLIVLGRTLSWWHRTYVLIDGVLRVDEGVFVHNHRLVPCDRVQQVTLGRKLRHRVLGLATLRVETAGGAGESEVNLDALREGEARRLRAALLAARAVAPASAASLAPVVPDRADPVAPPVPAGSSEVIVQVGYADLALAGITGARLAIMLTVALWVVQVLDDLPGDIARRLDPSSFAPAGAPAVVATLGLGLALWLGLAAAASILADAGFTLSLVDGDLHVRRGLLDQKEAVVPLDRVQTVRVHQSFLRRLLGVASVRVDSAGDPGRAGASDAKLAVPLVAAARLEGLVATLLPGAVLPPLARPPVAARRRAVTRRVLPTLLAGGLFAVAVWPWGALALLAVPVAAAAGVLAYRGMGHALGDGHLVARHGALLRETVVVPLAKAQSGRVRSSVLQRRAGLATFHVDVARGRSPRVIDEAEHVADGLLSRVVGGGTHR